MGLRDHAWHRLLDSDKPPPALNAGRSAPSSGQRADHRPLQICVCKISAADRSPPSASRPAQDRRRAASSNGSGQHPVKAITFEQKLRTTRPAVFTHHVSNDATKYAAMTVSQWRSMTSCTILTGDPGAAPFQRGAAGGVVSPPFDSRSKAVPIRWLARWVESFRRACSTRCPVGVPFARLAERTFRTMVEAGPQSHGPRPALAAPAAVPDQAPGKLIPPGPGSQSMRGSCAGNPGLPFAAALRPCGSNAQLQRGYAGLSLWHGQEAAHMSTVC